MQMCSCFCFDADVPKHTMNVQVRWISAVPVVPVDHVDLIPRRPGTKFMNERDWTGTPGGVAELSVRSVLVQVEESEGNRTVNADLGPTKV